MSPADAAGVAQLSGELGYRTTIPEIAERISAVSSYPDHVVLVAESRDGRIVGWIHVFAALRIESRGFAEIGGLVVGSPYRRQGVGAQLVAAAEQAAARLEFATIRVRCRVDRGGARSFYREQGFLSVKTQRVYEKLVAANETTNARE
jgi:GNAT superfamily N-acetyltransferase